MLPFQRGHLCLAVEAPFELRCDLTEEIENDRQAKMSLFMCPLLCCAQKTTHCSVLPVNWYVVRCSSNEVEVASNGTRQARVYRITRLT